MPDIQDVTMERCTRPFEDELASLEVPFRPFPEGNGWFAHYFYRTGGAPAYKRLTHGDEADIWYRVVESH